jgi:hypothetical protein
MTRKRKGVYAKVLMPNFFLNTDPRVKYTRKGNTVYAFNLYDDFARPERLIQITMNDEATDSGIGNAKHTWYPQATECPVTTILLPGPLSVIWPVNFFCVKRV